ncbi:MAG TPA: 6-pyruvoyl-tetrahydropterin synthase-related protein [Patescibacteria group bacterium]|jgi:uncharacterized membrane protein|nr:6-pyruvoyl-tetrahydropterin synthase-related protein [Patescibacteria group bacterium]
MVTRKIQVYKLIRRNIYLILLLIIGLFFLFPLFHPGFYLSHDGFAHVARYAAYFKSYMDGQFPARWAGDLNSGYGTPIFIFFYPLPGFIATLLHLVGFHFETVFKIIMGTSFILAPICLFWWLRRQASEGIAFAASLIYMMLPYRFLDAYVRGDVAEIASFVFIPLVFLYIDKALEKKRIRDLLFGGIFYALFIMTHNGMAIIFSLVFLTYGLIFVRKRKELIYPLGILLLGICLSAFFTLPFIFETKYTMAKVILGSLYTQNFITPWNLFYSQWGFNPEVNVKGGLSPQIGIIYFIAPFVSLVFLLMHKIKEQRKTLFWLAVFILSVFVTTSYSKFLWDHLPLLNLLGYPWRFTALSGFASCMLIFYCFLFLKNNKIIIFLIVLVIFIFSLPLVTVNKYIPSKSDSFYLAYPGTTDYSLRTDTIWTAGEFSVHSKKQVEIIAGKGTISDLTRKSNLHTFSVNAITSMGILDNTAYFPGWKVTIDGEKTSIQFQDMDHRGLMEFNVPSGKHNVRVEFKETLIRLLSDIVSVVSLVLVAAVLLLGNRLKKYIRK